MNRKLPRFAPVRAGLLGLVGVAALVAACDTPMPTAADVQQMDVAAVEQQVARLRIVDGNGMTYFVDGREVTAKEARALVADRIAQVEVHKDAEGRGTIRISTGAAADGQEGTARIRAHELVPLLRDTANGAVPGPRRIVLRTHAAGGQGAHELVPTTGEFTGLILIDGVVAEPSAMQSLSPDRIDKVEVIKGPAAAQRFSDPRAANGVIRITTKAAARP